MLVMRPANPIFAVEVALLIHRLNQNGDITDEESLNLMEAMLKMQDYTFVGYLSKGGQCLEDKDGIIIGQVMIGDSFCEKLPNSEPVRGLPATSHSEG